VEHIFTHKALSPAGHYSQAVLYADTIYVSGQLPIDPSIGEKRVGSIKE
jgi:2-iminobutanoate/2-iminopropanoate deaminase